MQMRTRLETVVGTALFGALLLGCGRGMSVAESNFDIPPSLIHRMSVEYNANLNKTTGTTGPLDGNEMMSPSLDGMNTAFSA